MPQINDGSAIISLNSAYFNEWMEPNPGLQTRRYVGFARLTLLAQLAIPIFAPAKGKGKADIPLTIGVGEVVYRVNCLRGIGINIPTAAALKVAVTLADAGAIVSPIAAANYIGAGSTLASGSGRPGGTPIVLGAAATPLQLFSVVAATPTTAAATGALIQSPVNATDLLDVAMRRGDIAEANRNLVIVEIMTEAIAPAPTMTPTNFNIYAEYIQRLQKAV
jgi:hypothetical protein